MNIKKETMYTFDGLKNACRNEVIDFIEELMKEIDFQPTWYDHKESDSDLPRVPVTPSGTYMYALKVINSRCKEWEHLIMEEPKYSYLYALNVIGGRWEEAEPIIMTDPQYAYSYAIEVIKGRWELGETVIKEDSYYAYLYARDILKERWWDAEPYIMETSWWKRYIRDLG
jgi:hypothetical protein